MTKNRNLWIVIADGATARIVTLGKLSKLALVSKTTDKKSRERARALRSDAPGRSFSSARSGARHAIEPKHDFHKLEKHKFALQVANDLEQARSQNRFDELILVAPRRTLGEMRKLLSPDVCKHLVLEVPKDLTHCPLGELWPHLSAAVNKIPERAIAKS